MIDATSQHVLGRFSDCTLPKPEWTHEAHLRVCWATLQTMSAATAVDVLRRGIRSYNEATGVANTDTDGYHETLTQYFVGTVDSLDAASIDEVLRDDRCSTAAPLRHWSRGVLFSTAARRGWVEPDLEPLPWPPLPARPSDER